MEVIDQIYNFSSFMILVFHPSEESAILAVGMGGRNLAYFQICFSTGIVHKNSKNVFL